MPSPSGFKKGFEIAEGTEFGGYSVEHIVCGHDVKKEFERYEFPMTISMERTAGGGPPEAALQALAAHTTASRIIYSEYGSPYECHFGAPKINSTEDDGRVVTITTRGWAVRRHDMPTQAQVAKQHGAGVWEISDEARAQLAHTHRVIKSHFSTATCPSCGDNIPAGVYIAQAKEMAGKRGGWTHAVCAQGKGKGQAAAAATGEDEADEAADSAGKPRKRKRGSRGKGSSKRHKDAISAGRDEDSDGRSASEDASEQVLEYRPLTRLSSPDIGDEGHAGASAGHALTIEHITSGPQLAKSTHGHGHGHGHPHSGASASKGMATAAKAAHATTAAGLDTAEA